MLSSLMLSILSIVVFIALCFTLGRIFIYFVEGPIVADPEDVMIIGFMLLIAAVTVHIIRAGLESLF